MGPEQRSGPVAQSNGCHGRGCKGVQAHAAESGFLSVSLRGAGDFTKLGCLQVHGGTGRQGIRGRNVPSGGGETRSRLALSRQQSSLDSNRKWEDILRTEEAGRDQGEGGCIRVLVT